MWGGGAETGPGPLLSTAAMPRLEPRPHWTQPGSTQHVSCHISIAPGPGWGISRSIEVPRSASPAPGLVLHHLDITWWWVARCPLAFLGV